ncbi:TULIP family P47-like protein [Bacillus sp. SCS-151]|uniref:TULIP family P47-like protein n=1 Tax=Nanhaiella sioensis TaxID=3115293 RepID=UPI00397DC381
MSETIELFGWDTVYGSSFATANDAIKELKSTPDSFNAESDDKTITLTGNWGDWEITTESDGRNLSLLCPIVDGTYTGISQNDENLDGGSITIEVELAFLQEILTEEEKDIQKLVISNDTSISIVGHSFSNMERADQAIFKELFLEWFQKNITEFKHVFSIFFMNASKDKTFKWLTPTDVSFAISSINTGDKKQDLNKSVIGIMMMTEGNPRPINIHSIDERMLRDGKASFAIAPRLFLEKWLLPGVVQAFNVDESYFDIRPDGTSIENIKKINWAKAKVNNETVDISVEAGQYSLSLFQNTLKASFDGVNWSSDEKHYNASMQYTQTYQLHVGKDGLLTLVEIDNSDPHIDISSTGNWELILDLCLDIGLPLLTAGLGFGLTKVGEYLGLKVISEDAVKAEAEKITDESLNKANQANVDVVSLNEDSQIASMPINSRFPLIELAQQDVDSASIASLTQENVASLDPQNSSLLLSPRSLLDAQNGILLVDENDGSVISSVRSSESLPSLVLDSDDESHFAEDGSVRSDSLVTIPIDSSNPSVISSFEAEPVSRNWRTPLSGRTFHTKYLKAAIAISGIGGAIKTLVDWSDGKFTDPDVTLGKTNTVQGFTEQAVTSVQWANDSEFELTDIQLVGGNMLLVGDLK